MYDACVPWPERPKGAKDKSRGPKGLELEVGARRAPKLLVQYNVDCDVDCKEKDDAITNSASLQRLNFEHFDQQSKNHDKR